MAWPYVYKAGPAGSEETLTTYCVSVRIAAEWATGRRGMNPVVQYRHGEYSSPRKYVRASNLMLETVIRYTSSGGTVTHSDGAAGHFYENLGHLKRLFGGTQNSLVRLQRTAPDQGTVHLDVELLGEALPTGDKRIFNWPLHAPHPFWIGASDTGNTPTTFTVAGDAPIGDLVATFSTGATDATLTHTASGAYIKIAGVMPAGGVTVDVGAGTCTKVSGGADYSAYLVVNKPWWMELDPGANAVTIAGGGTVSVDWYTQWR